jgi:hypothetical protein
MKAAVIRNAPTAQVAGLEEELAPARAPAPLAGRETPPTPSDLLNKLTERKGKQVPPGWRRWGSTKLREEGAQQNSGVPHPGWA